MLFSISTIAAVAALLSQGTTQVNAVAIEERANSLCNQQYYGASGKPWQSNSQPGSFCGSQKPSNSGIWKNLPLWDGGDTVKCSKKNNGLRVCNGGNKKTNLPSKCNPPHRHPKSSAAPSSSSTKAPVVSSTSSPSAPASSSSAAGSSVSSAAGSSVSSAAGSSSSSVSVPASSSASASPSDPGSSSTSSANPSTPTQDPTSDPVCELTYQVQFQNYTLVAPNGYWYGQTVGAAVNDASYMTYTLATSVDDCLAACDQIEGCVFVNSYYDQEDDETYLPKHTPGVLTCAMYSTCPGTDSLTNWGGQNDPNVIVDSNGYCKSGACGGAS